MARSAVSLYFNFASSIPEGVSEYLVTKKNQFTDEQWTTICRSLAQSTCVYVGNLSFFTTESQIYTLFSTVGPVKRVIMGLNRSTRQFCGFCFVEYYDHKSAVDARVYLNGAILDRRPIKVDIDEGFEAGREFGKGKHGGQVRDEVRQGFDIDRGGWGVEAVAAAAALDEDEDTNEDMKDRDHRDTNTTTE